MMAIAGVQCIRVAGCLDALRPEQPAALVYFVFAVEYTFSTSSP